MEFEALEINDRPEMMAIGDSLYNGVRSLTIKEDLAQGSPPAQVARGLGIAIEVPDYRRPVLFDLEEELRDGIDLDRIRSNILDNADRWIEERGAWSSARFFDNISVAGFDYRDLHRTTAGALRPQIPRHLAQLRADKGLNFSALVDLYMALNTAFLLNPTGDPDFEDLTSLEWVASRKPRRLLINIGSNEGLFRIGISGAVTREYLDGVKTIPALTQTLAEALRDHCADVEHIYFNTLIRPRVIANLAPRTDDEMFQTPGDAYFKRYVGRLGSIGGISAAQMQRFDETVREVNESCARILRDTLGGKAHVIDTYALADDFDGKHYGNARKVQVQRGNTPLRLSNLPFSANIFGFRQGGLFSLDNMHLTKPGYTLLSNAVGKAIADAEGAAFTEIDPQDTFEADTLVTDPPRSVDRIGLVASLLALFVLRD